MIEPLLLLTWARALRHKALTENENPRETGPAGRMLHAWTISPNGLPVVNDVSHLPNLKLLDCKFCCVARHRI